MTLVAECKKVTHTKCPGLILTSEFKENLRGGGVWTYHQVTSIYMLVHLFRISAGVSGFKDESTEVCEVGGAIE